MSKLSEQVKGMDFIFIVEIHDILTGVWLEYAKFKEKEAAMEFINYQYVKEMVFYGETTFDLGNLWRVIEIKRS